MSELHKAKKGAVGVITLNRPTSKNAFTPEMYHGFSTALRDFQDDKDVHVVLLTAAGADFCAGNDISSFVLDEAIDPDVLADPAQTPSTAIVHTLIEFDKPLIACVQGRAIGWGATMLLHCDVVIVDETASFIFPFVDIGIAPEAGSTQLLAERMGWMRAVRAVMLGEPVPAEQAVSFGLASELVAAGAAEETGRRIADALAGKHPEALRATKRLMRRDPEPLTGRVTEEFKAMGSLLNTERTQAVFRGFGARK